MILILFFKLVCFGGTCFVVVWFIILYHAMIETILFLAIFHRFICFTQKQVDVSVKRTKLCRLICGHFVVFC